MPAGVNPVALRLTAGEQLRAEKKGRRLLLLLTGLTGYGTALALLVSSGLGASSWTVLAEGIAEQAGLSIGMAVNLVSLAILVFWIPLRELPGLGTVLNIIVVGSAADLAAHFLPHPDSLPHQFLYYGLGLVLFAFCDALYLGARFGAGPRDGLMTGAVRVLEKPVWQVRTCIEVVVLTAGCILGGTLGPGTLLLALAAGPLIHLFLRCLTVPLKVDEMQAAHAAADRA